MERMKGMAREAGDDLNRHDDALRPSVSYRVTVEGASGSFACRSDQTVIEAMHARGRTDLRYACRGGGCGACRVSVRSGEYALLPMSEGCVTRAQRQEGIALACRIKPRGDLTLIPAPLPGALHTRGCVA